MTISQPAAIVIGSRSDRITSAGDAMDARSPTVRTQGETDMPDHLAPGHRPSPVAPAPWAIESCMFTWIFDLRRRRFRRVPAGTPATGPVPSDAWVAYH